MTGSKVNKSSVEKKSFSLNAILPWLILVVTLAAYSPSLQNQFLHWDDDNYIANNPDVKTFSIHNTGNYFTRSYNETYVPLTMLTWAIEYALYGEKPMGFILLNILLHLATTFLVFLIVRQWTKNNNIALVCMALFGLHPMHVESVSWITERKDVLYGLFFLLSLWQYGKYLEKLKTRPGITIWKNKNIFLALLFFVLSLLSKGQAVTLPLVLILMDWLYRRKILSKKVILEKFPFFLLSIGFGLLALHFQKAISTGGRPLYYFPVTDKIFLCSYALVHYVLKIVFPVGLSAAYPLPLPYRPLPAVYKYYLFPALLFVALMIWLLIKKRKYGFGLAFFFINIVFMLDHSSVGKFIMADRFIYMASIGIFFIIGSLLEDIPQHRPGLKQTGYYFLVAFLIFCGTMTWKRSKLWRNEEVLFSQAIQIYPDNPIAYNELGSYFLEKKNYERSRNYLDGAILMFPEFSDAYTNRGLIFYRQQNMDAALKDYETALQLSPDLYQAWQNRGLVFMMKDDYKEAERCFEEAIRRSNGRFLTAYLNRAEVSMKFNRLDSALNDCNYFIRLDPENPEGYYTRGKVWEMAKEYDYAMKDYNRSIQMKPDNPAYLYARAALRGEVLHDADGAFTDLNEVLRLDSSFYQAWNGLGVIYSLRGDPEKGLYCFDRCLAQDTDYPFALVNRGIHYMMTHQPDKARIDIEKALKAKATVPEELLKQLGLK